ncbi:MAG: hypothetical protein WCS94_14210 [Verrucomicrobiota bacterium]
MKTILTIGSDSYLVPQTTDLNKILDLFQGMKCVRNESLYGPDKARYEEPYYINRMVTEDHDTEVSVALIHDSKVVSRRSWNLTVEEHNAACAAFKPAVETISAGS